MFVGLLILCATFSKYLQDDELNLLVALTYSTFLFQTIKETDKLSSIIKDFISDHFIAVHTKSLTKKMERKMYHQVQKLKNLMEVKFMFESNYKLCCLKVTNCIKNHIELPDLQLFRDIIEILTTQGWQKINKLQDETDSSTEP